MWLSSGFSLGNHTQSHPDLNKTDVSAYEEDIIRGEKTTKELLRQRGERIEYFRYPYLHAGKDPKTKAEVERFLATRNYRLAPVTIDNQEWVFAQVYARAMQRHDANLSRRIAAAYLAYMETMFEFCEKTSVEVVGYEVRQILLLHDNLLNADCFDELVEMMRRRGYSFISLDEALQDRAYALPDEYVGIQGLSWLHRWAIAKGLKPKEDPREPEWIDKLYQLNVQ